jgi:hypothetical protein
LIRIEREVSMAEKSLGELTVIIGRCLRAGREQKDSTLMADFSFVLSPLYGIS